MTTNIFTNLRCLSDKVIKGQEWKFDQNKLQIVQNLWAEKTEIELFFEN